MFVSRLCAHFALLRREAKRVGKKKNQEEKSSLGRREEKRRKKETSSGRRTQRESSPFLPYRSTHLSKSRRKKNRKQFTGYEKRREETASNFLLQIPPRRKERKKNRTWEERRKRKKGNGGDACFNLLLLVLPAEKGRRSDSPGVPTRKEKRAFLVQDPDTSSPSHARAVRKGKTKGRLSVKKGRGKKKRPTRGSKSFLDRSFFDAREEEYQKI